MNVVVGAVSVELRVDFAASPCAPTIGWPAAGEAAWMVANRRLGPAHRPT